MVSAAYIAMYINMWFYFLLQRHSASVSAAQSSLDVMLLRYVYAYQLEYLTPVKHQISELAFIAQGLTRGLRNTVSYQILVGAHKMIMKSVSFFFFLVGFSLAAYRPYISMWNLKYSETYCHKPWFMNAQVMGDIVEVLNFIKVVLCVSKPNNLK